MNTKIITAISVLALAILLGVCVYPFLAPEGMYYPYPRPIQVKHYSEEFIKRKGVTQEQLDRAALREFTDELESKERKELNLRERNIRLDPNPWPRLIHLARFDDPDIKQGGEYIKWLPAMNIYGRTYEEVMQMYEKDKQTLQHHWIDTLRYGEPIQKNGFRVLEANYIVSKIHHAEIHWLRWKWKASAKEPQLLYETTIRDVFFIKDGKELRAFYGYEVTGDFFWDHVGAIILGTEDEDWTMPPQYFNPVLRYDVSE